MSTELYDLFKDHPDDVLIVGHRNADLDSIVPALILRIFFKKILKIRRVSLLFPEGISEKSSNILRKIGIRFNYNKIYSSKKYNVIYFLDIGGVGVLGKEGEKLLKFGGMKILIDHHQKIPEFEKYFNIIIVDPSYSSTTEIVLNIISRFIHMQWLEDKYKIAILVTLYVETRFLNYASNNALYWFSLFTKELGIKAFELRRYVVYEESISEKIAVLKTLKRMRIYRYEDIILVISEVSAFMSQVSSILARLGGDIIVIYTSKRGRCRIHIRLSDMLSSKYKINLFTDLIKPKYMGRMDVTFGGHKNLINIEYNGTGCNSFIEDFIQTLREHLAVRYGFNFKYLEA